MNGMKRMENGYLNFDTFKEYRSETRAARKDDDFPKVLPDSLKIAVKCFVLSLAIRESRIPLMIKSDLYQEHNTMLVHISRFTFWQNKTKKLIEEYTEEIKSKINNDKPSGLNSIYSELEKIWYSNYGFAHIIENIKSYLPNGYEDEFMTPIVYDSLKPFLIAAVEGIEVKAINSVTKEKLEYPKNTAKKIIAIGGNRLSRGFTLEGLTINYFIRVTNYSDALLQMGRWFGYRPGYLDCCKIFTTQDSLDKFNSTTKCIEELETEFIKMEDKGKDPSSFVLRVKKHPGTLNITRPSILKNAFEVKWSYQDQLEMTTNLKVDKKSIDEIWANFKNKIAPKFENPTEKEDIIMYKTDGSEIINILNNQPNNFNVKDQGYLSKFIELSNEMGYLNDWTVALKITGSSKVGLSKENLGLDSSLKIKPIELAKRSGPKNDNDVTKFLKEQIFRASSKSANIISSNEDMSILLNEAEIELAKTSFYSKKAIELRRKDDSLSLEDAASKAKSKFKTIPERYYREQMKDTQGLLMIYLFDSKYAFNELGIIKPEHEPLKEKFQNYILKNNIDTSIPLIGYALEFPPIENDPGGIYMQGDYDLEVDEEDEEGSDDYEGIEDNKDI